MRLRQQATVGCAPHCCPGASVTASAAQMLALIASHIKPPC